MYVWERETTISNAYQKVILAIKQAGLICEKQSIGDTILTTHVKLWNAEKEIVSAGTGKGMKGVSEVGALFEALEHYYTEQDALENCRIFSSHKIPNIDIFNGERVIQLLKTEQEGNLLCRKYSPLDSTKLNTWYPLFITNPYYAEETTHSEDQFNYKKLKRYSSNSGIAIGSTFHEALIHATNEVIERDAWSLFLLHYYYHQTHSVLQVMNKQTLPDALKELIQYAEQEVGEHIILLNITTETNIPTILAIIPNHTNMPYVGLGTSLYVEYAISRAVTELVQTFHMTQTFPEQAQEERKAILEALKNYPQHYRCAEFCTQRLFSLEQKQISFDSVATFAHQSLQSYVQELACRLHHCGFEMYYSPLASLNTHIHMINVLIPNMERFFLNYEGYFALPSVRGQRFLMKMERNENKYETSQNKN